jgi:hypothetical protein
MIQKFEGGDTSDGTTVDMFYLSSGNMVVAVKKLRGLE